MALLRLDFGQVVAEPNINSAIHHTHAAFTENRSDTAFPQPTAE
jgi:hypothetical protein